MILPDIVEFFHDIFHILSRHKEAEEKLFYPDPTNLLS
jgi:hemerythrin superfamily protein